MQPGLRTLRIAGAFASAGALVACPILEGLNQSYTGPAGDGGVVGDGGFAIDAGCPLECGVKATDSWTPVAFGAGVARCPQGFENRAGVERKAPGVCGACGGVVPDPTCEMGALLAKGGTLCTVDASAGYAANGGGCVTGAIDFFANVALTGPAPQGGSCAASTITSDAATAPAAVCASTSTTCATQACSAAFGAGFQACLYSSGDVTCPAPTTVKHTVGSGVTTACACTVDLSQVTCGGWLSIYGSQVSCSGSPVVRLPVDGTCHPMSGVEAGDSYEYAPSFVGTVSCSAVADGGDDITNPGTVCCPQ